MKRSIIPRLLLSSALLCLPAQVSSRVLDDFNDNTKTAWEDFTFVPGFGLPVEQDGQFQFSLPPAGQALFVASTKTSETFTLEEGKTIEFRADLVSGNGADSFAVLGFIPQSSDASTLAGYGLAKSTTDVLITKGIGKYFYNENPPEPLKNENVTLVLSLTARDGSVIITGKVLDKDNNNAVIFEQTFIDTPAADILSDGEDDPAAPYGGPGNFVLFCYQDFDEGSPQESYDVVFDNAEVFVLENVLVDDFNDNEKTNWEDFTFIPGFGIPVEKDGQFVFEQPPAGQAIFSASTKTSPTFSLDPGERLEFRVDLVTGNEKDSFAVLSYIPSGASASDLAGYSLAKSTTDILITKGINKYFYNENPPEPIKNENVTLVLSLEARGESVFINAKVLDKDNNNAVLFEETFVDTPSADILSDGEDDPPAPYMGPGRFVLFCYQDFDEGAPEDPYRVVFDNAWAAAPPQAGNAPPVISEITPANTANFADASAGLSFSILDDQDLDPADVTLTLNGQAYTAAEGLEVTGSGAALEGSFAGLEENVNYVAVITVTDAGGESASSTVYFDTFSPSNRIIEAEDYNYFSGLFIDDPVPYPEFSGPYLDGYVQQIGTPDVDYHDTRTSFDEVPYRFDDYVRMRRSLDHVREKFADAGGAEAMVFDYDVTDTAAGEWMNYTRTFAEGTYEVYLRESLVNGTQVEAQLQEVTSDPMLFDQTTRTLGSFITPTTGFTYRNIPLTGALGQEKVVVRLSGETTLRLHQVSSQPSDGGVFQNYLIFVPVEDAGPRAPAVASLSPANGASVEGLSPQITAAIQNRDTDVDVDSIKLFINGEEASAEVTATAEGASLSYDLDPLPPSGSAIDVRLEFTDSEGVAQSHEWSFTLNYPSVNPAYRVTPGEERGFNVHFVQAPQGSQLENSLARAEDQLAAGSTIPKLAETNAVSEVVNFVEFFGGFGGEIQGDYVVPGLEEGFNGSDDYAVEITAYLELSAGIHEFGIITDDGYKLQAPASFEDRTAPPLAFHNGGPANETFEFLVPEAGVYPFRMVWYERSGSGSAEWVSIDPETGEKMLINDPFYPNAIKAYTTASAPELQVESAAVVTGPYELEAGAVIDAEARRITVPLGGGTRFFRLRGSAAHQLANPAVLENQLVFEYE